MMAALLLMFVMMLSGITLLFQRSNQELQNKNAEYEAMSESLQEQMSENEARSLELEEKENAVAELEKALAEKTQAYLTQSEELKEKTAAFNTQSAELEAKTKELEEKEALLILQEAAYALQSQELGEKTAALDEILGVRRSIIEALRQEFSDASLTVNEQTGAITFDAGLLFDYNSSQLKGTGVQFLEGFFPRYVEILLGEHFAQYISEIIIEGHTDTVGSYLFNLQLSQSRALAVASYILSETETVFPEDRREELRKIVTANGRSWSNPVLNPDGTVNMEGSRRVEIQFRLKDEEMIAQMAEALGDGSGSS